MRRNKTHTGHAICWLLHCNNPEAWLLFPICWVTTWPITCSSLDPLYIVPFWKPFEFPKISLPKRSYKLIHSSTLMWSRPSNNSKKAKCQHQILSQWMLQYSYPPVDVTAIMSKYSHGRVSGVITPSSTSLGIRCFSINKEDIPRTLPPCSVYESGSLV